jgi:hypothetical protein
MNAVTSASISCCRIHSRLVRTVSVISPAWMAASRSVRSKSVRDRVGDPELEVGAAAVPDGGDGGMFGLPCREVSGHGELLEGLAVASARRPILDR